MTNLNSEYDFDHTATYSPDDNKLRLYPAYRLDAETYARVKAAGFKWAGRQELFVAPMWTPQREKLLIELCGEVEDENKTLLERQEERAETFEGFSASRAKDSERAHKTAQVIGSAIPFGQPILVGHHSEKRHRRAIESIDSNMRKACDMWKASKYWTERAIAARMHAEFKQDPAVRHRRIKTLEADLRKQESYLVQETNGKANPAYIAHYQAWINHYENRIAYETAMLQESGGIITDKFNIKVGGKIQVREEWLTVLRVNKDASGRISSVCCPGQWNYRIRIENVIGYQDPAEGAEEAVKAVLKLAPMCNYLRDGFLSMTKEEYAKTHNDYKQGVQHKATDTVGKHRTRAVYRAGRMSNVFLTDSKVIEPPTI